MTLCAAAADGFPRCSTSLCWQHFDHQRQRQRQRQRLFVVLARQTPLPPDTRLRLGRGPAGVGGGGGRRRCGLLAGVDGRLQAAVVLRHAQGRRRQRGRRNSTATRFACIQSIHSTNWADFSARSYCVYSRPPAPTLDLHILQPFYSFTEI